MRDYITIGSSPNNEECVQVGSADYKNRMRTECNVYKRQLERTYPGVEFGIKGFEHDFGTYFEVVAYFDTENETEVDAAFGAELGADTWDDQAREELVKLSSFTLGEC